MPIISIMKAEGKAKEQPREMNKLLRRLLLPFGGGEFYFSGGEKTLFLVDLTLPAENETGANFDVRLAYALIALARDCGAGEIILGVCAEEGFDFDLVLKNSSYAKLAELERVSIVDLRRAARAERATDTALVADQVELYRPLAEADVIVSLAKFKAGEGRLFGSALNNIANAVRLDSKYSFAEKQRALVDVYSILSPDLTIVDGLRGESKLQPQQGDFVLAAIDAVAADAVLAALAGIELESVEYLQLAAQYGLGVGEPGDIRLFGDDISGLMV